MTWVVRVKSKLDEVYSFDRVVICDCGLSFLAVNADWITGEDCFPECLVSLGVVGVAVGAAGSVCLCAAGWAFASTGVECGAAWCGAYSEGHGVSWWLGVVVVRGVAVSCAIGTRLRCPHRVHV